MKDDGYDFSFSGLKSAVLNHINGCKMKGEVINEADVAASFQASVTEVLVGKTLKLAKEKGIDKIALAGGVAANTGLREAMKEACDKEGKKLYYPELVLCTDNAAMIGCAAYYEYLRGGRADMTLNAVPNLPIGFR